MESLDRHWAKIDKVRYNIFPTVLCFYDLKTLTISMILYSNPTESFNKHSKSSICMRSRPTSLAQT